jgi:hypothetical protein
MDQHAEIGCLQSTSKYGHTYPQTLTLCTLPWRHAAAATTTACAGAADGCCSNNNKGVLQVRQPGLAASCNVCLWVWRLGVAASCCSSTNMPATGTGPGAGGFVPMGQQLAGSGSASTGAYDHIIQSLVSFVLDTMP